MEKYFKYLKITHYDGAIVDGMINYGCIRSNLYHYLYTSKSIFTYAEHAYYHNTTYCRILLFHQHGKFRASNQQNSAKTGLKRKWHFTSPRKKQCKSQAMGVNVAVKHHRAVPHELDHHHSTDIKQAYAIAPTGTRAYKHHSHTPLSLTNRNKRIKKGE